MYDVDHILPKESLEYVRGFDGQKIQFRREFAVLDEQGAITQDRAVLQQYGLPEDRDTMLKPLPNNFAMRRDIFWQLGGYREDLVAKPYPQGEDREFKRRWHEWRISGRGNVDVHRPLLYMFPCGQFCGDVDYNPFGLFHGLTRKTRQNYWHQRILQGHRR
jgi:hypothetical protein